MLADIGVDLPMKGDQIDLDFVRNETLRVPGYDAVLGLLERERR
ncbi:MAG: hypothetical protein OXQ89_07255 [Rhodospirillaceae bacterium]|nr:hypothetical protein [Rhodospirillaceae bacterium]